MHPVRPTRHGKEKAQKVTRHNQNINLQVTALPEKIGGESHALLIEIGGSLGYHGVRMARNLFDSVGVLTLLIPQHSVKYSVRT
jgi:hypothetical protein